MKKRNQIVFLTGGLGNQLFQLAHGLSNISTNKLDFETRLGNPRGSEYPDLFDFNLSSDISGKIHNKSNWFISKCLSYILHLGVNPNYFEKQKYLRKMIGNGVGIACSLFFKTRIKVQCFNGVGYSQQDVDIKRKNFFIGYFQTYKWVENLGTKTILMNITTKNSSSELELLRDEAKMLNPLIVHVRLTDYKSESSFGIPSQSYYKLAIEKLWSSERFREIWIFTDEPDLVLKYLPKSLPGKFRIIGEIGNSPAMTLEAMRYGHGYILANSSFGWWGAYLSYTPDAKVIAPLPWFLNRDEPLDICPPKWERMNAFQESIE
jgi:hypothetical protein